MPVNTTNTWLNTYLSSDLTSNYPKSSSKYTGFRGGSGIETAARSLLSKDGMVSPDSVR